MSEKMRLLARQQLLMRHKAKIEACLSAIKDQRNRLEIEHLQLESMIAQLQEKSNVNDDTAEARVPNQPMQLDSIEEINSQQIDLALNEELLKIFSGQPDIDAFLQELEEDEDTDEDEDDDDDEDEDDDNEVDPGILII